MRKHLFMGDLHCGADNGLTPPSMFGRTRNPRFNEGVWDAFVEHLGNNRYDSLTLGGDLTDGAGKRSGSRDVWTVVPEEQAECGIEIIKYIKKNHLNEGAQINGVKGTAYHVVFGGCDAEELIAKEVGMNLQYEQFLNIDGKIVHCRHHIGGRNKPHTQGTQLSETKLRNLYQEDIGTEPKADVFMRWHLHQYKYFGEDSYVAMIMPCLKGPNDEFGGRVCGGSVRMGFVEAWVEDDEFRWNAPRIELVYQMKPVTTV